MRKTRQYSLLDRCCIAIDTALGALSGQSDRLNKPYPAQGVMDVDLSAQEKRHVAGLMRVNHAGEICAQALYHGQALVSKDAAIKQKMQQAAKEEGDHLAWCQLRLDELQSHTSYLNPLWYSGSFCIGFAAGMVNDAWSLGFVAETERQVINHLAGHSQLLPASDLRSYHILQQMEIDEAKHRDEAITQGARELPWLIKQTMALTAKIMVKTAYWI
jgi:3-demethoxyubiquinol 3-hydroxylase